MHCALSLCLLLICVLCKQTVRPMLPPRRRRLRLEFRFCVVLFVLSTFCASLRNNVDLLCSAISPVFHCAFAFGGVSLYSRMGSCADTRQSQTRVVVALCVLVSVLLLALVSVVKTQQLSIIVTDSVMWTIASWIDWLMRNESGAEWLWMFVRFTSKTLFALVLEFKFGNEMRKWHQISFINIPLSNTILHYSYHSKRAQNSSALQGLNTWKQGRERYAWETKGND